MFLSRILNVSFDFLELYVIGIVSYDKLPFISIYSAYNSRTIGNSSFHFLVWRTFTILDFFGWYSINKAIITPSSSP